MNVWEFLDENGAWLFLALVCLLSELPNIIKALK